MAELDDSGATSTGVATGYVTSTRRADRPADA